MWTDTKTRSQPWKHEYFKGSDNKTYIRFVAENGEKIARSNRGFKDEDEAIAHMALLKVYSKKTAEVPGSSNGQYVAKVGNLDGETGSLYFTSETLTSRAYAQNVAQELKKLL